MSYRWCTAEGLRVTGDAVDAHGPDDWTLGWPAAAERVEVWEGRLVFQLRGFIKAVWTDQDVAAAERCYPGQRVTLSPSRAMLFVAPPAGDSEQINGAPAGRTEVERGVRERRQSGNTDADVRRPRTVVRVTRDQVEAARGLVRLRSPEDVGPLIRKVADARPETMAARGGRSSMVEPGHE